MAKLAFEDGFVLKGLPLGAEGVTNGEVVFNTAMTGYQEILTDPSYAGQIVTLTYPHSGNVGVNAEDVESLRPFAAGLIIADLDTRRLTRALREKGAQNGCIVAGPAAGGANADEAVARARAAPSLAG